MGGLYFKARLTARLSGLVEKHTKNSKRNSQLGRFSCLDLSLALSPSFNSHSHSLLLPFISLPPIQTWPAGQLFSRHSLLTNNAGQVRESNGKIGFSVGLGGSADLRQLKPANPPRRVDTFPTPRTPARRSQAPIKVSVRMN